MPPLPARLKSRKFLVALLGQLTGLVVLFAPEHQDQVVAASQNIGALLLMALTAMGYIAGEAKVDAARAESEVFREAAEPEKDPKQPAFTFPRGEGFAHTGLLLLICAVLALFAVGCQTDPAFLASAENYHRTVGGYVDDTIDASDLTAEEKALYHARHDSFGRVLEAQRQGNRVLP